jgi:hypothetical protein
MPSGFPDALDAFATDWTNQSPSDNAHPLAHNDLADAINKIEAAVPRVRQITADAAAVVGTAYGNAGLSFPIPANVVRRFMFLARWSPDAATTGARFALNGPSLTSLVYSVRWNTTATVITTALGIAYDAAHTVGTASNNSPSNLVIIEGLILCSAAGDVQLRAAAEVASPGAVQLRAGSSVVFW